MSHRPDPSGRSIPVLALAALLAVAGTGSAAAVTATPETSRVAASSAASAGGSDEVGSLLAGSYSAETRRLSVDPREEVANKRLPFVDGEAVVGTEVSADPGRWSPDANRFEYQWLLDGEAIDGATGETYTPGVDDKGGDLAVAVTAFARRYDPGTAVSDDVTVRLPRIESVRKPQLKGQAKTGKTLSVSGATWSVRGATVSYRWLRDGRAIRGADERTYKLVNADLGKRVSVELVATMDGYTPARVTSPRTTKVTRGR